ncbi:MAG TPA: glycosyltransferase family A protein [Polyangiales bacterium]
MVRVRRLHFSLILATVGRTDEVLKFLRSLEQQTLQSYQLIVVDQNQDDRIDRLLGRVNLGGDVLHLRSSPGLSLARNVGLTHATGELIAFPDDDCWYPCGVLERVAQIMDQSGGRFHGVTGRSVDEQGRESSGAFSREAGLVDEYDVWQKAISYTIFVRAEVCRAVGGFDEQLGVGAGSPFGSGEETDYLIRAMRAGFVLKYFPDLVIGHPWKESLLDARAIRKAYDYGAGMGRVLTKHHYPLSFKLRSIVLPVLGAVSAVCKLDLPLARQRVQRARGRFFGMVADA